MDIEDAAIRDHAVRTDDNRRNVSIFKKKKKDYIKKRFRSVMKNIGGL